MIYAESVFCQLYKSHLHVLCSVSMKRSRWFTGYWQTLCTVMYILQLFQM